MKSEGAAPEAALEVAPAVDPRARRAVRLPRPPRPPRLRHRRQGLHPPDADALPPLLLGRTVVKTHTEETTLWDRPWALGLFFAVLTVEWILRKRAGLP